MNFSRAVNHFIIIVKPILSLNERKVLLESHFYFDQSLFAVMRNLTTIVNKRRDFSTSNITWNYDIGNIEVSHLVIT